MSVQKKIKKAHSCLDAGKHAQAVALFREVLQQQPNHAEALYYMGLAAQGAKEHKAAEVFFQRAIASDPRHAKAHFQLGLLYDAAQRPAEAAIQYIRAMQAEPGNPNYVHAFTEKLKVTSFTQPNPLFMQSLLHVLPSPHIESDKLFRPWYDLYRLTPGFHALAALKDITPLTAEAANRAVDDPFLITGLCYAMVRNYGFETLLTQLRKAILLEGLVDAVSPAFLAALALQNFHNEYIWEETPEETAAIDALTQRVGGGLTVNGLLVLGAYRALHRVPGIDKAQALLSGDPTGFSANVWQQQVTEPQAEAAIKHEIPAITAIDDRISQAVREQYEENPYPRWQGLNAPQPMPVRDYLKNQYPWLPADVYTAMPANCTVLVAGCGTGRQALESASFFTNTRIEAVDLSASSLAYAIRKKRALRPEVPVTFMQADILRLGEHYKPESFDVVMCSGVLHHMHDPMAGWRVITGLLKKNGVMLVGLYSRHARKAVTEMRARIAAEGIPATQEGIRSLRKQVVAQPETESAKWLLSLPDFYTTSDCRDLLFHVQEHQFTFPQIAAALEELGLELTGFEGSCRQAIPAFRRMFPDSPLPGTLAEWDAFEQAHPHTFSAMYQFWVRKKG